MRRTLDDPLPGRGGEISELRRFVSRYVFRRRLRIELPHESRLRVAQAGSQKVLGGGEEPSDRQRSHRMPRKFRGDPIRGVSLLLALLASPLPCSGVRQSSDEDDPDQT